MQESRSVPKTYPTLTEPVWVLTLGPQSFKDDLLVSVTKNTSAVDVCSQVTFHGHLNVYM